MTHFLFGISAGEIILIFLVVLIAFGSKKLPDLARSIGKGVNEFKKVTDEIKREFEQSVDEMKDEASDLSKDIHNPKHEEISMSNEVHEDIEQHKKNLINKQTTDDTPKNNLNDTSTSSE